MLRVVQSGDRLLGEWVTWLRAQGQSEGTVGIRRHYGGRFLGAYPDPWAVTPEQAAGWLAWPSWSPETRKSARSSVRCLYRWGLAVGRTDHDPTVSLPGVRVPRSQPRPAPHAVLAAAWEQGDASDRLALALAAYAGLRRAEIARVHSDDVSTLGLRVHGKGGAVRTVPIHPCVWPLLRDVRGWAFPSPRGGHVTPDAVGRRLARLLGGGWTAHTLRHQFATRAYAGTRDLRAVQELLGHTSPATTARYVAVADQALIDAVLSIPA